MRISPFQISDLSELITLYQTCFAEPPWYELFQPEELVTYFTEIQALERSIFLVAEDQGQIVGCAIGFPIVKKPEVLELISVPDAFYLAELFVRADRRNQGLAKKLIEHRFELARWAGFKRAYVRTSVDQTVIVNLYLRVYDFQLITSQAVTSRKVIDEVEKLIPDTRLIMGGQIPLPESVRRRDEWV
ncbi:MAG: GNAT family N-acetyltransferase [Candidatus Uhrbacteria bacterium]